MKWLKRILDIVLSLTFLILAFPVFLLIAIWVRWDSAGSVFFRQQRVGRDGADFRIWKFRTMAPGTPEQGPDCVIEASDPRVTRSGTFLRAWSLDELPQLINILLGKMSLVGPRPTLRYQVEQYTPRQRRRLQVRPGLTGWAQIHGRNRLSWPERIEYDLWYVENWSLWLDIRILLRTPAILWRSEGLYGRREDFRIHSDNE